MKRRRETTPQGQEGLFAGAARTRAGDALKAPLADRMRPERLDEVVGQLHVIGPGKLLGKAIAEDRVPSMILWGPPGSGKTTLARVVAGQTHARFVPFSAVLGGVPELRTILAEARRARNEEGARTILFIDEIHRFNKSQQDGLLPFVESGLVTLIGATTENPSFEVNSALLSRAQVYVLRSISDDELMLLLERALQEALPDLELTPSARSTYDPPLANFSVTRASPDFSSVFNSCDSTSTSAVLRATTV